MANKRVIELPDLSQDVQEGQYILVDSSGGTGKMNLKHIVDEAGSFDPEGMYPELYAGNLTTDKEQTDTAPYLFRRTAGGLQRIDDLCYPALVGASVGENQLVQNGDFETTTGWVATNCTISASGNVAQVTLTNSGARIERPVSTVGNHKYLIVASANPSNDTSFNYYLLKSDFSYSLSKTISASKNAWNTLAYIVAPTNDCNRMWLSYSQLGASDNIQIKNAMCIDLTQMLGSSIADYAYTLEQQTAGSGIAWLRSYGFLSSGYVPYNAGAIESVEVTEKVCVGFNQWDEEWEVGAYSTSTGAKTTTSAGRIRSKNFISVLPNTAYYSSELVDGICFYDAEQNYIGYSLARNVITPANAFYMTFYSKTNYGATYNNDICINLSSNRDGEYEPYKSTTYSLGSDTLRGIFKLSNGAIYADGDRKEADGTITRYYGTRNYQEGDESLADAITDGTTTVYKLTTPTTETSTPFTSPQICYPDGTEQFVTENGVPVGHETSYPYDLKGLVEGLIDVPDVPSTNGTYVLKATRSSSWVVYNWVTG